MGSPLVRSEPLKPGRRPEPWLAVGCALALVATLASCSPHRGPDLSVLIVDLDTLRADRLGHYGNPRPTSPTLDALARQGVVFEWAFSQAPNTPPSQASILTGMYPYRHGRVGDFDSILPNIPTLAEYLQRAGMRTAAFVDGGHMRPGFGLERGFDSYVNMRGSGLRKSVPAALSWLEEHGGEPFFLLIHTYDIHSPYSPPEPYRSRFAKLVGNPSPGFEPTSEVLEAVRAANNRGEATRLPEADLEYALAQYDAGIRYADDWVARLLRGVDDAGLRKRTAVVVLSDHGEEFQEHGSVLHEKLYATVTHIPLIFDVPHLDQARVVGDVVQSIDVAPTLLEMLRIEPDTPVDGQSLWPLVLGERSQTPRWAYSQSPFFGEERSLVREGWRLHQRLESGRRELYRYREDPLEQHDLWQSRPDQAARMAQHMTALEARFGERRQGTAAPPELDEETREELRELGYVK